MEYSELTHLFAILPDTKLVLKSIYGHSDLGNANTSVSPETILHKREHSSDYDQCTYSGYTPGLQAKASANRGQSSQYTCRMCSNTTNKSNLDNGTM